MEGSQIDLSSVLKVLHRYEDALKQRSLELDTKQASIDTIFSQRERQLKQQLEDREKELERRELQLKERVAQWEKSKGDLKLSLAPVVKLNVGGQIFTTSLQTLRKVEGGMFAGMFSGRFDLQVDDQGAYFIDRDPKYFPIILNFLRDGYVPPFDSFADARVKKELLREADFYGLEQLAEAMSDDNSSYRGEIESIERDEIDLSLPDGIQSGDFVPRYPRGYEIVTKRPVTLQAVKVKLKMHPASEGWVRLYSAEDLKQLAEGSFFYGIGKKAWVKSSISYKLLPQKRYLLIVFSETRERGDKYYYTPYGGNPQVGREVGPFTVYGRSANNKIGEPLDPVSNVHNIAIKLLLENTSTSITSSHNDDS